MPRLSLLSFFFVLSITCFGQAYVLNSVPYFTPAVADRTAGNKLNYSNGIVCTGTCMAFNNVFTRLPGSLSLQSIVFAPPTSPCTCGGSIRCENSLFKNGVDSTVKNKFYQYSFYPYNYYSPRDNQNELHFQLKNVYTGASNDPNIAIWDRPLGSTLTKLDLIVTYDTLDPAQGNQVQIIVPIDTLDTNVWTDIVLEVGWAANYTGYVKVYQNGILKATYNGATKDKPYNPAQERIPVPLWGIYKFPYCQAPGTINTTQKLMYFDVLRVGNANTVITDYFIASTPVPQPPTVQTFNNPVITLPTSTTTLNGRSTTPAGTITSRLWTQVSGTSATISSPSSDTTNITGLSTAGTRVFQLKATNTAGLSDSALATVTVNPEPPPANLPPVVNAGIKRVITLPQDTVNLSGSATDPDGTIVSYLWSTVSGGSPTIVSPTATTTNVTGLLEGKYVFSLTATDDDGATGSATVEVNVLAAPIPNTNPRLRVRAGF